MTKIQDAEKQARADRVFLVWCCMSTAVASLLTSLAVVLCG